MNVEPMTVHGWKFKLTNSNLLITSEQDAHSHLQLSAQAAYSLLDYLYQYRDDLYEATRQEANEEVEQRKAELRTPEMRDELLSE
jgi:hypothetical protein